MCLELSNPENVQFRILEFHLVVKELIVETLLLMAFRVARRNPIRCDANVFQKDQNAMVIITTPKR